MICAGLPVHFYLKASQSTSHVSSLASNWLKPRNGRLLAILVPFYKLSATVDKAVYQSRLHIMDEP